MTVRPAAKPPRRLWTPSSSEGGCAYLQAWNRTSGRTYRVDGSQLWRNCLRLPHRTVRCHGCNAGSTISPAATR